MILKEVADILPYITKCYETEVHLYSEFGQGETPDPANMAKLEADAMKSDTSKFYIVEQDEKFIGYFGTYKIHDWNALSSFFILPEHRELKADFFNTISNLLENKYIISVKSKNTRAVKFVEKLGATKYYSVEDNTYFKLGDF